jgi:hypothetical protein
MTLIDINTEKITRIYLEKLEQLFEADSDRDQASTILLFLTITMVMMLITLNGKWLRDTLLRFVKS